MCEALKLCVWCVLRASGPVWYAYVIFVIHAPSQVLSVARRVVFSSRRLRHPPTPSFPLSHFSLCCV